MSKSGQKAEDASMGVVYKAKDTKLDRTAALKLLPRRLLTDPDAEKRSVNEAEAV